MSEKLETVTTEVNPVRIENPVLAALLAYWNRKRGDRVMPSRGDIVPSDIKDYLGWVTILEVFPDLSDFRYRLIGTLVAKYWLRDHTGHTVSEAFAKSGPAAVKGVKAMFRKCAREHAILRSFGEADWIGRGFEAFDCICLPLSDDGINVNMILHAFVFDRSEVMLAREIARANGGRLPTRPKTKAS